MKTDIFKHERQAYLDSARVAARRLLTTRSEITIADVSKIVPRPKYLHVNTTGRVFMHPDFKLLGHVKSPARLAHSRYIGRWTLSDDARHVLNNRRVSRERQTVS